MAVVKGGVEQRVKVQCWSFSAIFKNVPNFASAAAVLMECNLTALSSLRKGTWCGMTPSDTGKVLGYELLVSRADFLTFVCLWCGWSLDSAFFFFPKLLLMVF